MVAIVLLLQAHRQLTVPELGARLEVSERTVRRDLDALLRTGIPIYARRGRGGGWALVDGHRINLSALTSEEAQALFFVAGRELLAGLGIDQGVTSALRKLLAALPEATRSEATKVQQGVYVDPTRWGQRLVEAPGVLAELRGAVLAGRQLDLRYVKPGQAAVQRRVHPHGLVCKGGAWYLLAGTPAGLRTFRVSRIETVEVSGDAVDRPADFDLVRAWEEMNRDMPKWPARVTVEIEVQPNALTAVHDFIGTGNLTPVPHDGPTRFTVPFPSVEAAAMDLIHLGNRVRVLDPPAVQAELARIGAELVDAYGRVCT